MRRLATAIIGAQVFALRDRDMASSTAHPRCGLNVTAREDSGEIMILP